MEPGIRCQLAPLVTKRTLFAIAAVDTRFTTLPFSGMAFKVTCGESVSGYFEGKSGFNCSTGAWNKHGTGSLVLLAAADRAGQVC